MPTFGTRTTAATVTRLWVGTASGNETASILIKDQ